MAILHLVRHGRHDWLKRGFPGRLPGVYLTEQGVEDAKRVGAWLAKRPIDRIVASPMERAQQTAQPLAEALNLPIQTEPDFTELDFGKWSGLSFEDLAKQPDWELWQHGRSMARPPEGENIAEVQCRVATLLLRLADEHPEEEIVLFGHGDPIKSGVAHWLAIPLDNLTRIDVEPASVSTLEIGTTGPKVVWVNRIV